MKKKTHEHLLIGGNELQILGCSIRFKGVDVASLEESPLKDEFIDWLIQADSILRNVQQRTRGRRNVETWQSIPVGTYKDPCQ